jgi:hypothetical protein
LQALVAPAAAASATAVSATSTASISTTAAGSAATPAAATESAACRLGTSFIHVQRAAVHLGAIELLDCGFGFLLVGHFDKREPAGLPRIAIRNNIHTVHVSILRERGVQLVLGGLETQIPDKDIHLE